MKKRYLGLSSVYAITVAAMFYGPGAAAADGDSALKQEQDLPAAAAPKRASSDEIIVQARKRDESISDVPVAVSSLSAGEADRLILDDIADYIRQTPGAILVASGPAYLNDIALRGQGGGRLVFSEASTGIYRDGIYIAGGGFGGRTFSTMDFFDMQSFEVYRGPQGALYGRNAVGGAANVISRKPEDVFSVEAKAGYDNREKAEVSAVVNAPIVQDVLNARVGGYFSDRNGGFHSLQSTGEILDQMRDWGVRGSLGWAMASDTDALLTVEHSYSEAPGFAALGQNLTLDPDPFTKVGLDFVDTVVIEQTSVLGQFTHGFAFGDLTVLGNFKSRDGDRENGDLDHFFGFNTPLLTLVDEQFEDFTRHGAEVRLASPGGAAVEWLIGADYQTYESDVVSDRTGSVAGPFAFSAPLRSQIRRDQWTEELFSYSFFGLVGFDLTGRLNLTLEARVQHDDKDFLFERVDGDPFTNDAIPATLFSQSETKFLPTASLRYQIADGHNLYARFATGYRPGGFNYQPQVLFFDRTAYGPETAYSGEVGWKGEMQAGEMKLRADLAGFYTYTKDIQTTTQLAALVTVASLQNVGDAEIYGAEASLLATAPLFGGEFYANLGASTANGSFQDGASVIFGVTTYDLSGARTPRTRDYIVNVNVAYSHPVGSDFDAYISASLQAEGGGFDNALGDLGVADSRFSESFETLDLKAGLGTDNWRLSVYGKNVTDEVYRLVEVTNNSYHNDRRVYGAELAVNF